MQLTYVCAPLAGDIEGNIKRAREYCRQIRDMGGTPVSAHLMFDGVYDDNDPAQRKAALVAGLQILEICDSVIVFGGRINTLSLEDWLTQIMFPQTYARLNGDNTFTGNNTWSGNETHNGNVNVNGNLTVGGNNVALRTDGQVLRLRISGLSQSISSTPWAIFQGRTLADIVVAEQTNIDYSQFSIDPATGALTFPNIDAYVKYDIDIRPTGTSNVSGNNSAAVICRMLRQVAQTVATSGRVTVTGALPSLNMDSIFIPTFTMNAQDAYIQGGVVPQLLSGVAGTITQLDIVIFINRH